MKKQTANKAAMVVMILLLASAIGAIGFLGHKIYLAQKAREQARIEQAAAEVKRAEQEKQAAEQAAREAEAEAARIAAEQAAELAKIQKLATLGKSEGPEHPLIRQLVHNPDIMNGVKVKIGQEEYNLAYLGEDKSDKKAIKEWAGRTAHLLAIFSGYVDLKTGRQIRVKKAGEVVYVLDVNPPTKHWSVNIYKKQAKAASFSGELVATTGWLGVDPPATFRADIKDGVASFEYVWKPAKKKIKKQKK